MKYKPGSSPAHQAASAPRSRMRRCAPATVSLLPRGTKDSSREADRSPSRRRASLSMDATKPSEIKAAITTAEKWHGGIDVLVNNAALGYLAAIEEGEEQNIRTLLKHECVRRREHNPGSSTWYARPGKRDDHQRVVPPNGVVSMPALGYYSASKHALRRFDRSLVSRGVAPLSIKVLSIQPGGFRTYRRTQSAKPEDRRL